jgi:hypothetical protein
MGNKFFEGSTTRRAYEQGRTYGKSGSGYSSPLGIPTGHKRKAARAFEAGARAGAGARVAVPSQAARKRLRAAGQKDFGMGAQKRAMNTARKAGAMARHRPPGSPSGGQFY